jgi:phosphatidylethanolamine/phosphatidyl-N-methylethanolamine N-methyltransferase
MNKQPAGEIGLLRDFLWQAVRNYRDTGALAPSSKFLARLIVENSRIAGGQEILEIGAGTGVFTAELLRRLPMESRLLVLEKSPQFASLLRRRFPDVPVIEACASRLAEELGKFSLTGVDRVVSGLPWAAMPDDVQSLLLGEIRTSLRPGGVFTTFAYFGPHWLPAGRSFRRRLCNAFPKVETTKIELRNVPPAFVYRAAVD